jgi:hypothetical protein
MNHTLLRLLFTPGILLPLSARLFAQTDSLYAQQWNRDPIVNLTSVTSAQRQIITSEQVRASGYNRLSDVFQLIDGWTFSTANGENWLMQSNGAGSYDIQSWIIMVNGQRIDLPHTGLININALGIAVTEIDRIEIVNSTGIYLGEFSQKGIIHIITRKNTEGLHYRGYYSNGISTRDQGRLQQNRDLPSFVNPIGHNTAHALGFAKGRFNVTGALSYQQYYAPDTNVLARISYLDSSNRPLSTQLNTRLETQYTGTKMTHQLQLGYTLRDQGIYLNNPSKYEHYQYQAGYLGLWNMAVRHQMRFATSVSTLGAVYGAQTHQQFINSNLSYRYVVPFDNGNFIWQSGISHTNTYIAISGGEYANIFKPYTSLNIPLTRKSNLFADGMVSVHNDLVAPKASLGIYKRVSFLSNWSFIAAYSEQLGVEDFSFFYVNRNFLYGYYRTDPDDVSKQLSADFFYNLNIGNNVKFSFNSGIKQVQDEQTYILQNGTTGSGFYKEINIRPSDRTNWINRFNIHYDIVKNLVVDFNYMHTGIVERAADELRSIPKHKLSMVVQYEFPKKFTVWTRLYRQSSTKWNNYNTTTTELYSDLPSFFSCDLGLTKRLFRDYLGLNLTIRNLFNAQEVYYPYGAEFNTRFNVSISANIAGLFASGAAKP